MLRFIHPIIYNIHYIYIYKTYVYGYPHFQGQYFYNQVK